MQTSFDLRFKFLAYPLLAWICIGSMSAIAGGKQQGLNAAATPAALYQSYCSVCHGDQGNGQSRARASLNPPPLDFTQPGTGNTLTRERMILGVREGRPGTAMVGWKTQLTDKQIAQVVDYVRNKFMEPGGVQTSATGKAPSTSSINLPSATALSTHARVSTVRAPLKGDKAIGGKLYENNCTACHGKAGDGNGPRAYFISPRPRSFISAESRAAFTRPMLVSSIAMGKRGTEMPSWDKVLSDQEITNIAEYVFQQFIAAGSTTTLSAHK
jgi:mono/diheme cytochrome c family protein